jgi:hypothetical protein
VLRFGRVHWLCGREHWEEVGDISNGNLSLGLGFEKEFDIVENRWVRMVESMCFYKKRCIDLQLIF